MLLISKRRRKEKKKETLSTRKKKELILGEKELREKEQDEGLSFSLRDRGRRTASEASEQCKQPVKFKHKKDDEDIQDLSKSISSPQTKN